MRRADCRGQKRAHEEGVGGVVPTEGKGAGLSSATAGLRGAHSLVTSYITLNFPRSEGMLFYKRLICLKVLWDLMRSLTRYIRTLCFPRLLRQQQNGVSATYPVWRLC